MRLLRDGYFVSVALTHLLVDILNSQLAIVLVFLSPLLGLNNTDLGLITTVYITTSSLTQPLFGWLADRVPVNWYSGIGLLWMAGWFSAAILAAGRASLLLLVIAGVGSGIFHPTGTERATTRGRLLMAGRAATAASVFFLFGQVGLSLGPAIGGALLGRFGLRGLLVLGGLAVPVLANFFVQARRRGAAPGEKDAAHRAASPPRGVGVRRSLALLAFALLVVMRTAPQQVSSTFIPKLLQQQGFTPGQYGAIASLFMAGSAIGGVLGGAAADRFGRRRTVVWTLAAGIAPLYYFPVASGAIQYALIFAAGACSGASHSVIVVLAQSFMPRRMAFASGLTLGFMFASGSVGAYAAGYLADLYPLASVMQFSAVLVAVGALLGLTLEGERVSPTLTAAES
ncbi:MAG: MFS transporter [Anaerolineales bacterium]